MSTFAPLLVAVALSALSTAAAAGDAAADLERKLSAARPIDAVASPWIEELTWMEVRDRITAGDTTVIIPTGGIEENGPFLSTGKHNLIVAATCPVIARELGNALCAPVVKFVPEGAIEPPTGPMRFPGTISLREETYRALLTDIAASLRQAGFEHIVLIGDSGGNQRGMAAVAEALNARWSDAQVHFIGEFYDPGWTATEDFSRTLGVEQTRNDGHHDDIWVTAMMAAQDPQQIRYAQRRAAGLASINGVELAPLEQTIARGEAMIAFRACFTANAIRRAIGGNHAPSRACTATAP